MSETLARMVSVENLKNENEGLRSELEKYKKMHKDADEKQRAYWQYKIAFEKLVEVMGK